MFKCYLKILLGRGVTSISKVSVLFKKPLTSEQGTVVRNIHPEMCEASSCPVNLLLGVEIPTPVNMVNNSGQTV